MNIRKPQILIISALALLLVASLVYYFLIRSTPETPLINGEGTGGEISQTETVDQQNTGMGVNVVSPEGFELINEGPTDTRIVKTVDTVSVGPTNYIYISKIPDMGGETNFYITASDEHLGKLYNAQVGETVALSDDEQSEYFTYERMPDTEIGGMMAKVFVNDKPWELPGGTKETLYWVNAENGSYIIGSYTNSGDAYNLTDDEAWSIIESISF